MGNRLRGRPRVFRDPIHGDIKFPKGDFQVLLESILDTAMFQRLRHIRQNGVLNMVFHGAEHSRFSHALGVAWVAGRMFDSAYANTSDPSVCRDMGSEREDTILAALLHDVGHGPFSHTLEEILGSLGVDFDHERMTRRILTEEVSDIARLLGERQRRLLPFIDKEERRPDRWYYSIVSSELDADRLDYLLRDSTLAGVWTHRFDLNRLIDALGIHRNKIVVDGRARDVVESYLLALDQMYAAIYYHHTNRAASFLLRAVVQRAVDLARSDETQRAALFPRLLGSENPLWAITQQGEKVPLEVYETLDENQLWTLISMWTRAVDPTLSRLSSDLRRRRFPKAIPIRKEDFDGDELRQIGEKANESFRQKFQDRDPRYHVYVDKPTRKAYPGGVWEDGYAASVKLLLPDGRWEPAEKNERSVAKLIMGKAVYPSLIVPADFRDEAKKILEGVRS